MTWSSAFQLATAILASLGGGGAVVLALSNYLGKIWADRAIQKQKHEYESIVLNAKSELDKAANRYQVELDALTHLHQLRTNEEFARLGKLWRHMAILRNAYLGATEMGLRWVPADPDAKKQYKEKLRTEYEESLYEVRKFFQEEKLFIPAAIANCAESTLAVLIKENNLFRFFANSDEHNVKAQYTDRVESLHDQFEAGMSELETSMRRHIDGKRSESSTG